MGVESTALCLLYGKGAKAIVCDTGDEEDEMYERWMKSQYKNISEHKACGLFCHR